jgi:peptidoglycan/LPS O-acetylase OafA/YrhL
MAPLVNVRGWNCIGGIPYNGVTGTIYQYIQIPGWSINQNQALWGSIAAMFVIVAVLKIPVLKKFIGSKPLVRLGSYTYSLYLVHHPLIYTAGISPFIFFLHHFSYNQSVFMSAAMLIPVIVLATVLFYRYIEKPAIKLAGSFEKFVSSKESIVPQVERISKAIQRLGHKAKFF